MKKAIALVGLTCVLAAAGCATVGNADGVRIAALQSIGREQVAWVEKNPSAQPAGMDSLLALNSMRAHVDNISVTSPSEATALVSYRYDGRFRTDAGERTGTLTVQRRLHFTKNGSDWTQTGATEEVARSSSWSNSSQTGA